jgi:hypothetical protein
LVLRQLAARLRWPLQRHSRQWQVPRSVAPALNQQQTASLPLAKHLCYRYQALQLSFQVLVLLLFLSALFHCSTRLHQSQRLSFAAICRHCRCSLPR